MTVTTIESSDGGALDGFTELNGDVTGGELKPIEVPPIPEGEVEIHEATIEQLEAYLLESKKPKQLSQDNRQEVKDDGAAEQKTPDTEAAERQEARTEDDAATKQQALQSEDEQQAKLAQLRSAVEKQNLAFQRRSHELGLLRKELSALREERAKWLTDNKDSFLENPEDVIDRKLELKKLDDKLSEVDAHEAALNKRHEALSTAARHIAPDQFDIDAMASSLSRDGIPAENIQQFVHDPYSVADGAFLVQLARRAHAEKTLVNVVRYAKGLEAKIKELESKPGKVLSQIEKATKTNHLTGSAGGAVQSRVSHSSIDPDKIDLSAMSIEELQKLL